MAQDGCTRDNISHEGQNNGFIDEKVVDHYLITWTINNFQHLLKTSGRYVSSPPCYINSESWIITLTPVYLYSDVNYMNLRLMRGKAEKQSCAIDVTFRFGIKTNKTSWFEEKRQISFIPFGENITLCDLRKYFDDLNVLRENEINVLCEMYVVYSRDIFPPKCQTLKSHELYVLSSNIFRAYVSLQESDVLIQGTNIKYIPGHKAILSSRSPAFNKMLNETCTSITIPEEDCNHICNVLAYIYSGRINWVTSSGISIGLYECAKKYEIRGLIQLLIPSEIRMSTTLTEQVAQYAWNIGKFSSYKMKMNESITSPPFHCGMKDPLLWYLDIYPEGTQTSPNNVGIFVRNSNMKPIQYINICISIVNDMKEEYFLKNTDKPLYPDFVYGFPNYTTKELLRKNGLLQGDKLIISCKITRIFELHSFEKVNLEGRSSVLENTCLEQLSADFEKLYEDGNFADATLVANEKRFFVHKIILSTRSPVFTKLLKDKVKSSTITLTDVSPEVLDALLLYVYSGRLKNYSIRFINDLYSAANTYKISPLIPLCKRAALSFFRNSFCSGDKEKYLAKYRCF